jgi:hypothetical protein
LGDQIKEYEVKGSSNLLKVMRCAHKILVVEAEKNGYLGDLGVDGRIIKRIG